jgi:hypothetical protein
MDFRNQGNGNKQIRPRIVEIIGPAGAGKTTLCTVLIRYSDHIHLGNFPDVKKAANAPFFIRYSLQQISTLIRIFRHGDRLPSRREFAWFSILSGWSRVLQKELKRKGGIIFLDQGPLYLLSEISEFGPDYLKRKKAEPIWQTWYRRWAALLDGIVWLDTADEDLLRRIRNREKGHVVKEESAQVIFEYLGRYRKAYERTLLKLMANHNTLKVLRFDTCRESPEEIAIHLLAEFALKASSQTRILT